MVRCRVAASLPSVGYVLATKCSRFLSKLTSVALLHAPVSHVPTVLSQCTEQQYRAPPRALQESSVRGHTQRYLQSNYHTSGVQIPRQVNTDHA